MTDNNASNLFLSTFHRPFVHQMEAPSPTETVYVQNLNERVPLDDLRRAIADACGAAAVLEIKAKRALALRGQAFVVCATREDAGKVLHALQGRRLFGKSVVAAPARFRSDCHVVADGTYADEVARRAAERASRPLRVTRRQRLAELATRAALSVPAAGFGGGSESRSHGRSRAGRSGATRLPAALAAPAPPGTSRTLFVSCIRPGVASDALEKVFAGHAGFLEVRMVAARPDVAFVEFATEAQAAVALRSANGTFLGGGAIVVSFARR